MFVANQAIKLGMGKIASVALNCSCCFFPIHPSQLLFPYEENMMQQLKLSKHLEDYHQGCSYNGINLL